MLMYEMTWGLLSFENILEKVTQFRWLGTTTIILLSSLVKLGIKWIVDWRGSEMRMMLKSLLISNTILVRILFFCTFCKNTLRFLKTMLGHYS